MLAESAALGTTISTSEQWMRAYIHQAEQHGQNELQGYVIVVDL